jgi:hypothetical protein
MTAKTKKGPRRPAAAREAEALREIWLAGLGALVTTGETSAKAFDALVKRGKKLEPSLIAAAERTAREARGTVEELAGLAYRRSQALVGETLDRITPERRSPKSKNILHRLGDLAEALL